MKLSSNLSQGSTNCSILPSRMGEHGVSLENMENIENGENMEKMENINQMTWNTLLIIQNILFVTQNTFFGNQMTQNTLYYSFYGDSRINRNRRARRTWSRVTSKWENIKQDVKLWSELSEKTQGANKRQLIHKVKTWRRRKTSQELRTLSKSLSDCKSLLLNVMIQVSQFASNSPLFH